MRVAVIGSRQAPPDAAALILQHLPQNVTEIISGGARGIDSAAARVARELSIPLKEFLPDYDAYGRGAPLIRNRQIVAAADMVLAFWDGHSRGTQQAIVACIKQNVPVRIIPINRTEGSSDEALLETI